MKTYSITEVLTIKKVMHYEVHAENMNDAHIAYIDVPLGRVKITRVEPVEEKTTITIEEKK